MTWHRGQGILTCGVIGKDTGVDDLRAKRRRLAAEGALTMAASRGRIFTPSVIVNETHRGNWRRYVRLIPGGGGGGGGGGGDGRGRQSCLASVPPCVDRRISRRSTNAFPTSGESTRRVELYPYEPRFHRTLLSAGGRHLCDLCIAWQRP